MPEPYTDLVFALRREALVAVRIRGQETTWCVETRSLTYVRPFVAGLVRTLRPRRLLLAIAVDVDPASALVLTAAATEATRSWGVELVELPDLNRLAEVTTPQATPGDPDEDDALFS